MTNWGRATTYKGIRMRSRLEAAFAAHLDRGGTPWKYEPMCFADETGDYLPDFQIAPSLTTLYVELKPNLGQSQTVPARMDRILASEPTAMLAIVNPTGRWPEIGFRVVAQRLHIDDVWRGPLLGIAIPDHQPSEAALAKLGSARKARLEEMATGR